MLSYNKFILFKDKKWRATSCRKE